MNQYEVNGLQLPPLFVQLLEQGRWRHPGDEALQRLIPFLREPVDFMTQLESMRRESSGSLADEQGMATVFQVGRGSRSAEPICLPWLDVEKAVFVADNRVPGDDLGIALDFRTDGADPRVVANDWHQKPTGCVWREVAPAHSDFIVHLGL